MLRGMGDDNLSSPVHSAGHNRNGASSRILDTTITARSSFDREDWGSDLNARGARRARQSRNRWVALVVRECGASNCVSLDGLSVFTCDRLVVRIDFFVTRMSAPDLGNCLKSSS